MQLQELGRVSPAPVSHVKEEKDESVFQDILGKLYKERQWKLVVLVVSADLETVVSVWDLVSVYDVVNGVFCNLQT